jgi:thymidylate synthase
MWLSTSNPAQAFLRAYNAVTAEGEPNENTRRLTGVVIEVRNPLEFEAERWPSWRKWSQRYVEIEWEWYQAATRNPEMVEKVASIWTRMKDSFNEVNSNYGWQVERANQWGKCARGIADSVMTGKGTRKHVLTIYDGKERWLYEKDTPCTISFTFVLKRIDESKFKLDMHTHMRSNDVWYGLCNDLPAFALFQSKMADEVSRILTGTKGTPWRVSMGRLVHFVDDLHVYNEFLNRKQ